MPPVPSKQISNINVCSSLLTIMNALREFSKALRLYQDSLKVHAYQMITHPLHEFNLFLLHEFNLFLGLHRNPKSGNQLIVTGFTQIPAMDLSVLLREEIPVLSCLKKSFSHNPILDNQSLPALVADQRANLPILRIFFQNLFLTLSHFIQISRFPCAEYASSFHCTECSSSFRCAECAFSFHCGRCITSATGALHPRGAFFVS